MGVSVLLGNGNGTFGVPNVFFAGSSEVVVVADIDGDGYPDLVTDNRRDSDISVLLSYGDGTFAPPLDFLPSGTPFGVVVGDFNGDKLPDLASAAQGNNSVSVLLHQ
jgi:hypothetical protein